MKLTDLFESQTYASILTDDFQKRNGNYPKSGVPDTIEKLHSSDHDGASFSFKNTSEGEAKRWVEQFVLQRGLPIDNIHVQQDGDYDDDWVIVTVSAKRA